MLKSADHLLNYQTWGGVAFIAGGMRRAWGRGWGGGGGGGGELYTIGTHCKNIQSPCYMTLRVVHEG